MKSIVKKFLRNERGNFAIMMGISLLPIMMCTGASVDYVGFKRVDARMQVAAEAAMLAASKEVVKMRDNDYADNGNYDLSNAQLVEKLDEVFKPFFEANYEAGGYELGADQYTLEYIEADNITKLRISMNYDTAIMKAFGVDYMTATKEMIINLKVQPKNYVIDIIMCIDATGSMQNTLDGVQEAAQTFNNDLRTELGVGEYSKKLKIRVRPIFYRDWEEGRDYQNAMEAYNEAMDQYEDDYEDYEEDLAAWNSGSTSTYTGLPEDVREDLRWDFNRQWRWYYQDWRGRWQYSDRWYEPKTHKRIRYEGTYYYFTDLDDLEAWMDSFGDGGTYGGGEPPEEPVMPVEPVNHGLNMYDDFIDLDPSDEDAANEGVDKSELPETRSNALENFLGSTYAFGGHDWPEAAGACLNEAIRSNWYDNQSEDAKEYFDIPEHHVVIAEGDPIPAVTYSKVTPIPVVVFWSDATINSLQLSRDWLSPTTPTTYSGLENLWDDPNLIGQRHKLFIRFGPESASGFNTIMGWDRTYYGGSLSVGNNQAVKVIAKKILEAIPDMLRVGS